MTFSKLAVFVIAGMVAAASAPVLAAQQNPDSTPAATAAIPQAGDADQAAALVAQANAAAAANARAAQIAPAAPPTKIEPSPAARKKAMNYGFHAEIYDAKTMFCRDDATLGTRLVSKKCMSADEFEDYGLQLKIVRDMLRQKGYCTGGDVCGETPSSQSSGAR
ncbi:MAG TPA: hypothetical protein VGN99_07555 [Steroidobacteraceae bacterium]|jgi:hypothetical protein|nr:hypothetical protein [Steroidobacteraceae bacterium]